MIARVGERARATSDADATWRADEQMLHDMLDRAGVLDLNDNFEFTIGRGKPIQAEGPEGGLRFSVTARMAGSQQRQASGHAQPQSAISSQLDSMPGDVQQQAATARVHLKSGRSAVRSCP
jgi:hypothetical protein